MMPDLSNDTDIEETPRRIYGSPCDAYDPVNNERCKKHGRCMLIGKVEQCVFE